jgi:hypothetical protein
VGHPDTIGDSPAYTLICMRQGQPPVRLYFDQSSGLLLRMVRYTDTPIGRNPTQIDYADYREVDGVKVPFPSGRLRGSTDASPFRSRKPNRTCPSTTPSSPSPDPAPLAYGATANTVPFPALPPADVVP